MKGEFNGTFTSFYLLSKLPDTKSKHRYDCIASTEDYDPFEVRARRCRDGRFKCYLSGVPNTFSAIAHSNAEMVLSDSDNISSLLLYDIRHCLYYYGDVAGTDDALLVIFLPLYQTFELFIARGMKNNRKSLCDCAIKGLFDDVFANLRERAKPTNVTLKNQICYSNM
jgi:hypothetical protein